NPAALVRNILESLDGKATAQQISEWLIGDIFTETEWKRWWESTKKALKASGAFSVPSKKTDPIQIRGEGVSYANELLDTFNKARQPKEQIAALEQIVKSHQQFKEPEKRILQALPTALGPRWTDRGLDLMQQSHGRMVAQIPRILSEGGKHDELRTMLERSIREHSATSEMLAWLCSEREQWSELVTQELLGAIFAALEREQHNTAGRTGKLYRTLVEDRQLLGDIFRKSDVAAARDWMRRLQLSHLFDELTKRSLLARLVKVYPELESMITGAQSEDETAPLIVSWSSLERRKTEYEELVKTKIPENTREIALA